LFKKLTFLIVFLLIFSFNVFAANDTQEIKLSKSNYEMFEEHAEKEIEKIEKQYNIPKINQGFLISSKTIKPHLSFVLYEKNDYTLDIVVAEHSLGLSTNKILLSIVDIKAGLFTAYSFDKDYRYHGFFGGICFSIIKF